MAQQKVTLHHLQNSQSQRVVWLLEELEVPYILKFYPRVQGRSPPELARVHPLGKSPTLELPDGQMLTESLVITKYLIDTYDTNQKFKGDSSVSDDAWRDERLSSFAMTTLQPIVDIYVVFQSLNEHTPWLFRPVTKTICQKVFEAFVHPELSKMLGYVQTELGDRDYLMGANPGRPDIMISFPIDRIVQREWVDFDDYPQLKAWLQRRQDRESWKTGLEKSGGYDLKTID